MEELQQTSKQKCLTDWPRGKHLPQSSLEEEEEKVEREDKDVKEQDEQNEDRKI